MNSKNQKTLKSIYENPIRNDIAWKDSESLFLALDVEVSEGNG